MAARSQLLLLLATMLVACVSESEPLEYPTLVGRFADEGEPLPLIAEEAYLIFTYVSARAGIPVTVAATGHVEYRYSN
jgi:hypothetical protein